VPGWLVVLVCVSDSVVAPVAVFDTPEHV